MTGEEIENGELSMESWKEYKIGDAIQFNPKERIKKGEIAKKIAMEKLEPYTRKITGFEETEFTSGTKFRNGDTLLARITPCLENGKTARVDILNKNEVAFGSTEFIVLREKIGITDNDFIYYLSISPEFRNLAIKSMNGSSGRQRVQKYVLEQCEIKLPSLKEQKAIAHILSTLDEKIETNNQINKKLEEMAQAIFKQWFVDFEFPCLPKNYKFSGAGKPDDYDKVLTYNRVGGLPVPNGKSWFVYVLLCDDGSFYKGMTKDLYRRFYEHYTGIGAEWTKIHKPVKVIHYEKFNSQQEARKREEELKSGYGREWIKREYKKYQEGLPAHEVKEGLLAHEMKAGSPAHQTHLMIAGEMVKSELGMIPKGWEVGTIGDYVRVKSGYAFKSIWWEETGVPVVKIKDIENNTINFNAISYVSQDKIKFAKDFTVRGGDLLIAMTGATIGKFAIVPEVKSAVLVNQRVGKFFLGEEPIKNLGFIYCNLKRDEIFNEIVLKGDGSAQPNISPSAIESIKIVIAPKDFICNFNTMVNYMFERIVKNTYENNILIKLRDTLLPKLMSGEIRVPLK